VDEALERCSKLACRYLPSRLGPVRIVRFGSQKRTNKLR
jgi:hypothetical protein